MTRAEKPQVEYLAGLARLEIPAEEVPRYEKEFEAILDYIKKIESVPADDAGTDKTISGLSGVTRADEPADSGMAEELIACDPFRRGRLTGAPRVIKK